MSGRRVVAVDVGGTNTRFAIAEVEGGRVLSLGPATIYPTASHASLELAYAAFARASGKPLPRIAAISFAGPVGGDVLRLTNNDWLVRPASLAAALELDDLLVINDFGAVAHAVLQADEQAFAHVCGPDRMLPFDGTVSIVGPGTGLGVAFALHRDGRAFVVETEGGHIDFAPTDAIADRILDDLRARHGRVSLERVVAGPGLANIHRVLAAMQGVSVPARDDAALWAAALGGEDALALAALDSFCRTLGGVAGDIALMQGAGAVVLAGGVALRLAERLRSSGFAEGFVAKGRFERRMAEMPVKLLVHPQPGLLGAAAAWAARDG